MAERGFDFKREGAALVGFRGVARFQTFGRVQWIPAKQRGQDGIYGYCDGVGLPASHRSLIEIRISDGDNDPADYHAKASINPT